MTVTKQINKVIFVGTATTDVYPYSPTFSIFAATDLVVNEVLIATGVLTPLTLDAVTGGFTADLDGEGEFDGNITLSDGNLPATKKLVIQSVLPFTQQSDYTSFGPLPAETHERGLDRVVKICQQLQEQIDRSIKVSIDTEEAATSDELIAQINAAAIAAEAAQSAAETAETNAEASELAAAASEAAAAASAASVVVDDVTLEKTTDIHIKDGGVDTTQLAALAVETAKIDNDAVTEAKIVNDAVQKEHINSDVVRADNGLSQHTDGSLQVDPSDTNPGLEISDGGVRVDSDESTIERDAGGIRVKDAGISTAKLKTSQGEVSYAPGGSGHGGYAILIAGEGTATGEVHIGSVTTSYTTKVSIVIGAGEGHLTLPGGEYGFYPQSKSGSPGGNETGYCQQRYVTASGQDHWIFLLIDKITGDIRAAYSAPDHPMYGNGGDIQEVPHPFIGNDLTGLEIVILGKSDVAEVKDRSTKKDTILTIINRDYTVDVSKEEPYEPLHTGQFIDEDPVMVDVLPTGLKVRKLKHK